MKAPDNAAMARLTSGPATEMRMSRAGSALDCRDVFHQGDSADGQQNGDGAYGHTVVTGDHRMSQLVQHNTKPKTHAHQHQAAWQRRRRPW